MKKTVSSLILLLMLFAACNDDFLDRQPLDQISEGSYWTSYSDAMLYVNQFYPSIFGTHVGEWSPYPWSVEFNSDNLQNENYNRHFNGETTVPAAGGGYDFRKIRDVNYMLESMENIASDATVDHLKGEALFFRAYFYYDMLKLFGELPLQRPKA